MKADFEQQLGNVATLTNILIQQIEDGDLDSAVSEIEEILRWQPFTSWNIVESTMLV
jgi:predicted transcriptional regulator